MRRRIPRRTQTPTYTNKRTINKQILYIYIKRRAKLLSAATLNTASTSLAFADLQLKHGRRQQHETQRQNPSVPSTHTTRAETTYMLRCCMCSDAFCLCVSAK